MTGTNSRRKRNVKMSEENLMTNGRGVEFGAELDGGLGNDGQEPVFVHCCCPTVECTEISDTTTCH
jgi:hypothetical protein